MSTRIIALIAGIIAAVGLFYGGYTTSSNETAPEKCLYASVSAFPGKQDTESIFNTTKACKGLTDAEKVQISNHLASFMTASSK